MQQNVDFVGSNYWDFSIILVLFHLAITALQWRVGYVLPSRDLNKKNITKKHGLKHINWVNIYKQ